MKTSAKMQQHPDTQSIPENRTGTKTYRGYLNHMIKGNYCSGNVERSMLRATQRQINKAHKLVESHVTKDQVKGRVQRALVRAYWVDYGEYADGLAGGW